METCAAVLRRAARVAPDALAMRFRDATLTYGELFAASCRLATALDGLGLQRGDRVALTGPHTAHSLEQICALALAGFARVPLHDGNTAERHLHMLAHSGARVLITDAATAELLAPHLGELPDLIAVIIDDIDERGATAKHARRYADFVAAAPQEDRGWAVTGDDVISISYTGGTTGASKGTVQTQRSWLAVALELYLAFPTMGGTDPLLAAAPLSGATGSMLFGAIARLQPVVVLPRFSPVEFTDAVAAHRASLTMLLPTMAEELLDSGVAERADLSSLRAIFLVSLQMPAAQIRRATAALGDVLYIGYGQSESTPAAMLTPADIRASLDSDGQQLHSVGRPLPHADIALHDEHGAPVPVGEIGEVLISTVGTMREYWNDPARTAETLRPDGFVRTGDLGRFDGQGFLYLLGRVTDRISQPHRTVYPSVVEAELAGIEAIGEFAVVGVPGPDGVRVHLVTVPTNGIDDETVRSLIERALTPDTMPDVVSIWQCPLPRTPMGKLVRADIIAAEQG